MSEDSELGKQYPRVKGRCPSCHSETLFRGHGGYITCSVLGCKNPAAAHDLLAAEPAGRVGMGPERDALLDAAAEIVTLAIQMAHEKGAHTKASTADNWLAGLDEYRAGRAGRDAPEPAPLRVCTSCRHAHPVETHYMYLGTRGCTHPDWKKPMSSCAFVPLSVAGKPFGCSGWEARSDDQVPLDPELSASLDGLGRQKEPTTLGEHVQMLKRREQGTT